MHQNTVDRFRENVRNAVGRCQEHGRKVAGTCKKHDKDSVNVVGNISGGCKLIMLLCCNNVSWRLLFFRFNYISKICNGDKIMEFYHNAQYM